MPNLSLQVRYYESSALSRSQPYACYGPDNCTFDSAERYPVLIMLHGYECDHTSWPTLTRIGRYLAEYNLITVFPFGGNGWYTNSFDKQSKYEDDIIQNLIPEIVRSLPAIQPGRSWAIGGMSMGGYGAIRLTLKYPELFSCAISHGGALDRMTRDDVHPIFGDPVKNAVFRKEQSPLWLVEQLLCRFPIQRPYLFLDCAKSDPLLECNRSFSNHLNYLGYKHQYTEATGQHTWPYWNRAFRTILPAAAAHIGANRL